MDVYFLRHGIAADRDAWSGSDFDRPLTREGRARMRRETKALARLGLGLDAIVTSPLLRARETAAIVAKAVGLHGDAFHIDGAMGPEFDTERFAAIIARHVSARALLLVGHEPAMSATVGRIAGGATLSLKKGGLAYVALDGVTPRGTLRWLLEPKLLRGY
jgi:phosphohistidine phosphatase